MLYDIGGEEQYRFGSSTVGEPDVPPHDYLIDIEPHLYRVSRSQMDVVADLEFEELAGWARGVETSAAHLIKGGVLVLPDDPQ